MFLTVTDDFQLSASALLHQAYIPIVACVCNPGMRGRHWDLVSAAVGKRIEPGDDMTITKLLKVGGPACGGGGISSHFVPTEPNGSM